MPKSATLFINNQSLTEEHSIRNLGIYIDSNLNWKSQIKLQKRLNVVSAHYLNFVTISTAKPYWTYTMLLYIHF